MEKKTISTICALVSLLSCLTACNIVSLSSTTTVSVNPPKIPTDPDRPTQVCDEFLIKIMVADVEDLCGFSIDLEYDHKILEFLDAQRGPLLKEPMDSEFWCGKLSYQVLGQTQYFVRLEQLSTKPVNVGPHDKGTLATLRFICIGEGKGSFFFKSVLKDYPNREPIDHEKEWGTYEVVRRSAEIPVSRNYTLCADILNFKENNLFTIVADNVVLDLNGKTINNADGIGTAVTVSNEPNPKTNVTIKNGVITNFQYGVEITEGCSHIKICNVTISDTNEQAIKIEGSRNIQVCDNNVSRGLKECISLSKCSYCEVSRNVLSKNKNYGICLKNSDENIIRNNTITDNFNSGGIYVYESDENTIFNNNFINNIDEDGKVVHVNSVRSTNVWNWSYPYGGNFWDDYPRQSIDKFSGKNNTIPEADGIGDIPYVIDEDNQDEYPLMNRYNTTLKVFEVEHETTRTVCPVAAFSNSSITYFSFDRTLGHISSEVRNGTFCNVIVPKGLLDGAFTVVIDNATVYSIVNWDRTHIFVSFTYNQTHIHSVKIKGEYVMLTIEKTECQLADLNADGRVGIQDLFIVAKHFNHYTEECPKPE